MGFFSKIKDAKYTDGGNYVRPGVHKFRIQRCKFDKDRSGTPFFAIDLETLESSVGDNGKPVHAVGEIVSWMAHFKFAESAMGNVRGFAEAAVSAKLGEPVNFSTMEDAEVDELFDNITGEDQLLAGLEIKVSAVNIKTKKNTDFTKVKFMPVDADEE